MHFHVRYAKRTYLSDVDPKTNAIALIPISAMVMVKVTILAPILAPVVISVMRAYLRRSSY
jgi:hypothetical protein